MRDQAAQEKEVRSERLEEIASAISGTDDESVSAAIRGVARVLNNQSNEDLCNAIYVAGQSIAQAIDRLTDAIREQTSARVLQEEV